jgi:uncharacterized Zn-binding protein involved in type VI secretion
VSSDREYKKLMERLATLERVVRNSHRMATVHKVENGRHRVKFQEGDGGDEGGADTSPWIRSGHGGAMTEDRQFAEGETVHIFAPGGNLEHAYMVPGGFSDNHPQDKNSKKDNSTRRWRKPPEEDKGQSAGGSSGGGGGSQGQYGQSNSQAKKWKDSDEDHQETVTFEKRWHKIGETEYTVTKDGGELKHGKRSVKLTKDTVSITDGEGTMTIKGGAATFKGKSFTCEADNILLKGAVALGGEGGQPVALQGSRTNKGDTLVSQLSTKVTIV